MPDDGFEEGMEIPIYYDPMLSKLVVHAENREAALLRMINAIDQYRVVGVETTLDFCRFVMTHEAFKSGKFDTHFVNEHFKPENLSEMRTDEVQIAAIIAALDRMESKQSVATGSLEQSSQSLWKVNRSD